MRIALALLLLFSASPAWPQARASARGIYVNADTVLAGPTPTDTSRNPENAFVREFFRDYPTDFDYFDLPAHPEDNRLLPDLNYRVRPVREPWHLFVLTLLFCLAIAGLRYFRKEVKELFEGMVSNRLINQAARELGMLNNPFSLFHLIFSSLAIGGLLYFIIPGRLFPAGYGHPEIYLMLSALAAVVYLARGLLLRIAGLVFGIQEYVNSYLYILYTASGAFSFLIIILLLLKLLGPPFLAGPALPAMQAIFLFFFVYQYARGIWYLVDTFQFPKIYLILYLCAFEICPLLILGKGLFYS